MEGFFVCVRMIFLKKLHPYKLYEMFLLIFKKLCNEEKEKKGMGYKGKEGGRGMHKYIYDNKKEVRIR